MRTNWKWKGNMKRGEKRDAERSAKIAAARKARFEAAVNLEVLRLWKPSTPTQ